MSHQCAIPTDFARGNDGIFRCLICGDMWCECCTQRGAYCRHDCPSHPKPNEPHSDWWGKPWAITDSQPVTPEGETP